MLFYQRGSDQQGPSGAPRTPPGVADTPQVMVVEERGPAKDEVEQPSEVRDVVELTPVLGVSDAVPLAHGWGMRSEEPAPAFKCCGPQLRAWCARGARAQTGTEGKEAEKSGKAEGELSDDKSIGAGKKKTGKTERRRIEKLQKKAREKAGKAAAELGAALDAVDWVPAGERCVSPSSLVFI